MLVAKKKFHISDFKFESGEEIPVDIGYETHGTLSKEKNNVILVPHFFSGNSHAAGKYSETDEISGYWDALIGARKTIDTEKYFVISTDNLCNVQPFNPKIHTTGPATINPVTNKPYGLTFPMPTISDIVNTQKILLESLGVTSLYAIVGASLGGMIAWQWIVDYPQFAKKMIAIISNAKNPVITSMNVGQHSIRAIMNDPHFNNGDYYAGQKPIVGMQFAAQMMHVNAFTAKHIENTYHEQTDKNILGLINQGNYEEKIHNVTMQSANVCDPNHWLYTSRITMNHDIARKYNNIEEALQRIKADVLMICCNNDLFQQTCFNVDTCNILNKVGGKGEVFAYDSDFGHMSGVIKTELFDFKIKDFLD